MASKEAISRGVARRAAVLAFVEEYSRAGLSPSQQQVADAVGISRTWARTLIVELTASGALTRSEYTHRTLRATKTN